MASDDLVSESIDLSRLPLEAIAELPESVLGIALRHAVEAARQPDGTYASYKESLA